MSCCCSLPRSACRNCPEGTQFHGIPIQPCPLTPPNEFSWAGRKFRIIDGEVYELHPGLPPWMDEERKP